MLRFTAGLIVALALMAPGVSAEEPKDEKTAQPQKTERRTFRVLQDPKDISSFYRSGNSRTAHPAGPYGLASHYRSTASRRTGYLGWRAAAYEPPCLYVGPDGPYRRR